eukprot:gb/GEZJ01003069.1/.p1 GENE.gb/GEZJ01003069.1/~~gb/GEZJ01003069.1/.p1  ORF type:complete len:371 (-),score=26.76 gb/GEZJ01003069.1/:1577-2689(-)
MGGSSSHIGNCSPRNSQGTHPGGDCHKENLDAEETDRCYQRHTRREIEAAPSAPVSSVQTNRTWTKQQGSHYSELSSHHRSYPLFPILHIPSNDPFSSRVNPVIHALSHLYLGPSSENIAMNTADGSKVRPHPAQTTAYHTLMPLLKSQPADRTSESNPNYIFTSSKVIVEGLYLHFENPHTAFARGIFKRIVSQRIALPVPKQSSNPNDCQQWISRLPSTIQNLFPLETESAFQRILEEKLFTDTNAAQRRASLPSPILHASTSQYVLLLERLQKSKMLTWSIVHEEPESYSTLATALQMTLFSVTKSPGQDRLISWPRVQNELLPDPPHTPLPNPGLFESIRTNGNLLAVYFDVANMFHNITLPPSLS